MRYFWQIPLLILLMPIIFVAALIGFSFQSNHHPIGYGFGRSRR